MGFADRIDQIFQSLKAMMSKMFYHFHVVIDEPAVNISIDSIRWAVFGFLSRSYRKFPAGVHLPLRDFPNCKWLQLPTVTSTVTILQVDVTKHLFGEDSPFDFCNMFQMGCLVQSAPSKSPRLMLSPWALLCLWHRRCGDGDVGEKHRTTIYIKHHYMVLDLRSQVNIQHVLVCEDVW